MTSGQNVSEYLDTLGLVKSCFFKFFWLVKSCFFMFFQEKKMKKIEKNRGKKKIFVLQRPQRMRRFACLQDCLLTLTCHLAGSKDTHCHQRWTTQMELVWSTVHVGSIRLTVRETRVSHCLGLSLYQRMTQCL